MTSLLLTVADTFAITGRGLIVVPEPSADMFSHPTTLQVELRRPDGSRLEAAMDVYWAFQSPPRREQGWTCMVQSLAKIEVPIGTEIWYESPPNTSLERTREG